MARITPDFHTLELTARQAGSALACDFGSSAEYEAALIQERRDAGRYSKHDRWRFYLAIGCGLAVVILAVLII